MPPRVASAEGARALKPRASSRATRNTASMQDSGEDEGEKVAGAVRLRQQMSLYSLPYLMAWYAGWRAHAPASLKLPPIPSKRMGDREYLLDVIVDKQLDWSRDHKTEAGRTKEMSKCFSEHNEGAPNPIMLQAEIDLAVNSIPDSAHLHPFPTADAYSTHSIARIHRIVWMNPAELYRLRFGTAPRSR